MGSHRLLKTSVVKKTGARTKFAVRANAFVILYPRHPDESRDPVSTSLWVPVFARPTMIDYAHEN